MLTKREGSQQIKGWSVPQAATGEEGVIKVMVSDCLPKLHVVQTGYSKTQQLLCDEIALIPVSFILIRKEFS